MSDIQDADKFEVLIPEILIPLVTSIAENVRLQNKTCLNIFRLELLNPFCFKNFVLLRISGFSQRNDPVIAISLIAFLMPGNSPIFFNTALS